MKFLQSRRQPSRTGTRSSEIALSWSGAPPCSALAAAGKALCSLPSSWKQIAPAHGNHSAEAIAAAPDDEFFKKEASSKALRVAEMSITFIRLLTTRENTSQNTSL